MRPTSPVPILVGVGVTVVGFLLIAYAWTQVAGEEFVPLQLPYLVSGGLTGIGLVLVGLTIAAVQARRIEGAERARQLEQVSAAVAALREALVPTDDDLLSVSGPVPVLSEGPADPALTSTQDLSAWQPPPPPAHAMNGAEQADGAVWETPAP